MYFPYLRGRQYELIALRELVKENLIGRKVIPIIEPIKPTPTLIKTLEAYYAKERKISVILNPQVGSFTKEIEANDNGEMKEKYLNCRKTENLINAYIMNKKSAIELPKILSHGFDKKDLLLINNNRDYLDEYIDIYGTELPRYNLIPDESSFRRKIRKNRVLFADKFVKQERNNDYADMTDEFYSDDHLFYAEDGYEGFGDYSIVGSDFSESGFAPYAVAIHIVYFAEDNSLRIKHFVSNSNEDITNPANKFYEAVEKLVKWSKETSIKTAGIKKFVQHYNEGTYPGLGTVKKLALMHHIELMSKYLDEVL